MYHTSLFHFSNILNLENSKAYNIFQISDEQFLVNTNLNIVLINNKIFVLCKSVHLQFLMHIDTKR